MDIIDWQKEFKTDGAFWLPATPESRVYGTLTARAGYWPILNVLQGLLPQGTGQVAIAHGEIGGRPVSLLSCGNFSGTQENQVVGCEAILVGAHIGGETIGRVFTLRYSNLHTLIPLKVWDRTPDNNVLQFNFSTEHHIAHVIHSTLIIDIHARAPLAIKWTSSAPPSFNVSPSVSVTISAAAPLALQGIKELATDLGLLWSLLSGELSDVSGVSASSPVAMAVAHGHEDGADVSTELIWYCERIASDANCLGDMLHDLSDGDHADKLNSVIVEWLSKRDQLRTATRLLVDCWRPGVSREAQLGALAQSLEAFHRASDHRQLFIPEDEYAKIEETLAQAIGSCVPDRDLKVGLRKRIEFGNQVSLRRRTRDLFRNMPPALRDHFGPWRNLVDWMTDVRNQVIHRDPAIPPTAHRDLVRVTGMLGLVIHVSILLRIGVPEDSISNRILMQSRYQTLIRYWNMSDL